MLIDTHFHLDLMENMQNFIQELKKSDLGIIAVGTTPRALKQEQEDYCLGVNNIKVSLGIHPQLISERMNEVDLFLSLIKDCRYIGEIGLDFNSQYSTSKEKQLSCFQKIAKLCANEGKKVLSIHSVKAAGAIIDELNDAGTFESCICILHWFTGTTGERKRAVEAGAYFSINSRMLATKSGQETIKAIPAERILLETDAPFTKKIKGIRNLKVELKNIIAGISSIRGRDMSDQIKKNNEYIWEY